VLDQISAAADLKMGETILEIGPGTGVLTRELLNSGVNVVAVEKDVRACGLLNDKFANELENGKLNLIQGDILELRMQEIIAGKYSVVANIPYYITGALLQKFLQYAPRPEKMILLVQKEVADRIMARDSKESILSISVKAFGKPKLITKVPKGAFSPPPKVDSAVIRIDEISDGRFLEKNVAISRFFDILKSGFAHKRKFLINNLEAVAEKDLLLQAWKTLKLDKKVRAEDISLEQWFGISEIL